MVENVRSSFYNAFERFKLAFEIRYQDFDLAVGCCAPDLCDRLFEYARAEVGKVVAVYGSDNCVAEFHLLDSRSDSDGFSEIDGAGPAGLDVAVGASSGARVAEDHEGCCAAVPAFSDVRAGRFFADCIQTGALDLLANLKVVFAAGSFDFEPVRKLSFASWRTSFFYLGNQIFMFDSR